VRRGAVASGAAWLLATALLIAGGDDLASVCNGGGVRPAADAGRAHAASPAPIAGR
jgi:hypothetical protein